MQSLSKFDALVFDVDGVLCPATFRFAAYLEREHQLTGAQTREFFTGPFLDCLVGKADLKQVILPFLVQWGWQGSLDDFLQRWFGEESLVDARLLTVVRQIRARGIHCYVATNQEQYRTHYLREQMGFIDCFDQVFSSAEVGVTKPQTQFYAYVTQTIGTPPERILFWDDSPSNVTAARAYGWQAEHYTDYHTFYHSLNLLVS